MSIFSNHLQYGKRFYRNGLIDLTDYSIEPATADNKWDDFIAQSPERSIFVHSEFLQACGDPYALFWCFKQKERVAAIAIILDHISGRPSLETPVIYNGIFTGPPRYMQNVAQVRSDRFALFCFLAEELSVKFPDLKLRLSPQIEDMRPFMWLNYDNNGPKFKITVRYTSILELIDHSNINDYRSEGYGRMSTSRRQELRYARKNGYLTTEKYDLVLLGQLIKETFERQNVVQNLREYNQHMAVIEHLHKKSMLRSFVCGIPGQEIDSMAVFGVLGNTACYLYGGGRVDRRKSNAGTAILWDAFQSLAASKIRFVDLEGVNSPARGYFKLSFGGSLTPYYIIELA